MLPGGSGLSASDAAAETYPATLGSFLASTGIAAGLDLMPELGDQVVVAVPVARLPPKPLVAVQRDSLARVLPPE